MRIYTLIITAAAVLTAATACSSSASPGGHSTTAAHSTSSSVYSPKPGDSATVLAQHVHGCTGVKAESIGAGSKGGMVSAASCTLQGSLVIIDTWTEYSAANSINELVDSSRPTYYAYGHNWTALLADPGQTAATTTLQMQLTNDAGGLLQQGENGSTPPPAPSTDQHRISDQIANDLDGISSHAP